MRAVIRAQLDAFQKDDAERAFSLATPGIRETFGDGRAWIAIYPMQKQPDGSWRTNGCQLGLLAGTRT